MPTMPEGFTHFDCKAHGPVIVLTFSQIKILDESSIQIMGKEMFSVLETHGWMNIVLDFRNVEYYSSAAIGKLLTMGNKVRVAKAKWKLCSIRADIDETFHIVGLHKQRAVEFAGNFCKDLPEALGSF